MDFKGRITKVIEFSQLTIGDFADEIQVQRSSISHILSGRNKPSLDFLIKIKDRFPSLRWEWLIMGSGDMEEGAAKEVPQKKKPALPDLFAVINDESFGKDAEENSIPRDQNENTVNSQQSSTAASHRFKKIEVPENNPAENKIKKIVWFYENGKFESFEP